jgi:protease-4
MEEFNSSHSNEAGSPESTQPETPPTAQSEPVSSSRPEYSAPTAQPSSPQVTAERKNERRSGWLPFLGGFLLGCLPWLLLFGVILIIGLIAAAGAGHGTSEKQIALIRVSGVITGGEGENDLFSSATAGAEKLVELLEEARTDDSIKAIVLRINSPGGSAAGSEEVFNEIQRVRRSGKPVITSMGDVAASGGYYIASASDEIVADGATLTGSIGVIMELENFQKLFGKIGLDVNVIKSGKHKDMGSSFRPMTPDEKQLFQSMINDIYQQFVDAVAQGRHGKLTRAQILQLADGRVFTGRQALRARLIDRIRGLHDAVRIAGRKAGIRGEPEITEIGKPSFVDLFSTQSQDLTSEMTRKMLYDPRFQGAMRGLVH